MSATGKLVYKNVLMDGQVWRADVKVFEEGPGEFLVTFSSLEDGVDVDDYETYDGAYAAALEFIIDELLLRTTLKQVVTYG